MTAALLVWAIAFAVTPGDTQGEASRIGEVVSEVRVHGNHTTPTDDILALVGPVTGEAPTEELLRQVTARLEQSGRFAAVDVRKRYLSIDDPTRVLIVVVVNERPGVSGSDLTPGPWKRLTSSGMWTPMLEYQEGYGFTYGARFGFVNTLGPRSRISVPLTWGGERQARVEMERAFSGPIARVLGGGGISQRENPYYALDDQRRDVWGRIETAPRAWLRAGGGIRTAAVSFGDLDDRLTTVGADVTLDTRVDPAFPRNAVYASVDLERLDFDAFVPPAGGPPAGSATRVSLDGRGYVGVWRQTVLAVRGRSVSSSSPLPPYEQSLLGGAWSLRGSDVGSRADDNLAAFSAEVLAPITSPLSFARVGAKVFADVATVYASGESMADQVFERGYGVGVFLNATVLSLGLDVGWPENGGGPNMHFQLGVRLR